MDTPTIAKYYREKDPMERLKLLEQSIAAGEEPEENKIRKKTGSARNSGRSVTAIKLRLVIPGQTVISVSG